MCISSTHARWHDLAMGAFPWTNRRSINKSTWILRRSPIGSALRLAAACYLLHCTSGFARTSLPSADIRLSLEQLKPNADRKIQLNSTQLNSTSSLVQSSFRCALGFRHHENVLGFFGPRKLDNQIHRKGREWRLRQVTGSNFWVMWPWTLTSWPQKLTVPPPPSPWTTCAYLQHNRFLRFHNIVFSRSVTDGRTDGRTSR